MPAKNGFRMKDTNDIMELMGGSLIELFEFCSQNCQGQLLNVVGTNGGVEFTLSSFHYILYIVSIVSTQ